MTVHPTLEEHYRPNEAVLLWVRLQNDGPDLVGEVQVQVALGDSTGLYSVPISLPHQSRKEVPIIVGPLPRMNPAQLGIRFVSDGKTLLETQETLTAIPTDALVIGLWAADPAPLSFLSGIRSQVTTLALASRDIPDQVWPLRNLDVLILSGIDTSGFSSGQRQALAQWVGVGGHLVVTGSPNASLTLAGLPNEILPFRLEGETTLESLSALEDYISEPIPPTGPHLISLVSSPEETTLLAEESIPLIVTHPHGMGRVTFLALDPALSPLRSWAGSDRLWQQLLRGDPHDNLWRNHGLAEPYEMRSALSEATSLRLPSMVGIGALLLLYIILVGPINYMVLRRRQRLELAWLTIPLLTLLFALGAYGLGYATRGGERTLSTVSVVRMAPDGPIAIVDTYAGLFSPRKENYSFSAGPQALFGSLPAVPGSPPVGSRTLKIVQETDPRLEDFRVEQWSMQTFATRTLLEPAPKIQARAHHQGNRLHGTFVNQTATDFEECMVLNQQYFGNLGKLRAGQTLSTTVRLTNLTSYGFPAPGYANQPGDDVIRAVFGFVPRRTMAPLEMTLACWTEEGSSPLEAHRAPADTKSQTLYLIPLELGGPSTNPLMPVATATPTPVPVPTPTPIEQSILYPSWEIVEAWTQIPSCGDGLLPGQWRATLEYQLPPTFSVSQVQALTLTLEGEDWDPLPQVSFYIWETGLFWMLGNLPDEAAAGILTVPDAYIPRLIHSDDKSLRVHLEADSSTGSCLRPILAVQGGNP
jgi:hypothetical protein